MTFRDQGRGSTGDQLVQQAVEKLAPQLTLKAIITGEDAHGVELLNKTAETIGKHIADSVTTSQIRNIFGAVRIIEQDTKGLAKGDVLPLEVIRPLTMLRPKLAYQYGRTQGRDNDRRKVDMGALTTILSNSIALIGTSHAAFRNFVDFFEAILAYHRRYGGQNK